MYKGGYYWGKLVFPQDYPYKPPSILMITPSGRFKCNTRCVCVWVRVCLGLLFDLRGGRLCISCTYRALRAPKSLSASVWRFAGAQLVIAV